MATLASKKTPLKKALSDVDKFVDTYKHVGLSSDRGDLFMIANADDNNYGIDLKMSCFNAEYSIKIVEFERFVNARGKKDIRTIKTINHALTMTTFYKVKAHVYDNWFKL